jgi:hypothetical protein
MDIGFFAVPEAQSTSASRNLNSLPRWNGRIGGREPHSIARGHVFNRDERPENIKLPRSVKALGGMLEQNVTSFEPPCDDQAL